MRNSFVLLITVFFVFLCVAALPQHLVKSSYGAMVLKDYESYVARVKNDKNQELINVKSMIPDIVVDFNKVGTNNHFKRKLYTSNTAYLRYPAAVALKKIQDELKPKGIGLKLYDAYRPYSITVVLWEAVKDGRWVANPNRGSNHNRGGTVDVTLVDLKTGKELEMPTPYEGFNEKAVHGYMKLPKNVLENRKLLLTVMEKHGFKRYTGEWWHYDLKGASGYPLLDLSFEELEKK